MKQYKFLLAGNQFVLEMHLRQPGFMYSTYGPFTKSKERIQNFKETGDLQYIYRNELDKTCLYSYSDYGIRFDSRGEYSLLDSNVGKKVIIFRIDMSSSEYIDDKIKDILILCKGPTQRLNHMLTAETQYSISFTRLGIKFCLSLHYNGSNSFLFVYATKMYQFKAKGSEIRNSPLCLGNILEVFSANDMKKKKKKGLNRNAFVFCVEYIDIDTSNIIDIYKYLMKNHDIK